MPPVVRLTGYSSLSVIRGSGTGWEDGHFPLLGYAMWLK
jgi:hypothetical protein